MCSFKQQLNPGTLEPEPDLLMFQMMPVGAHVCTSKDVFKKSLPLKGNIHLLGAPAQAKSSTGLDPESGRYQIQPQRAC